MLTAIAQLGKASKESGRFRDDVDVLVEEPRAEHVIVIKVKITHAEQAEYAGLEFEERKKEDARLYLYRRDLSGKPGLFISGRIAAGDVRSLKSSLEKELDEEVDKVRKDFEKKNVLKKLLALTHGRGLQGVANPKINLICNVLRDNSERILDDLCQEVRVGEPEELLVTVKLVDNYGEGRYLGEVPEFVDLFEKAVTGVKSSEKLAEQLKCAICGGVAESAEFKENPLPFYFVDKPGFSPMGDPRSAFKVFPLCKTCFVDLRRGQVFIGRYLNFAVASSGGSGERLSFWLIPVLSDTRSYIDYLERMGNGKATGGAAPIYLRQLRNMCKQMEYITENDLSELDSKIDEYEAYLSFASLFYTLDKQGHMRSVSLSEGIYPKHLRMILKTKNHVDRLHPFRMVDVRFGFPLLWDIFHESEATGWYVTLATVLGDIFRGFPLDVRSFYEMFMHRVREVVKKEVNLREFERISFEVLSVLEYFLFLNSPVETMEEKEMKKLSDRVSESLPADVATSETVRHAKEFFDDHSKLLCNSMLRATCAVGVATGVLLSVQKKRTQGSTPFWSRLNRLEMTLDRIKELFPQIVNKLSEYKERDFDHLLTYLGSAEISHLDLSAKDIPKEDISLVFSVGMAEGVLLTQLGGK